MVLIIYNIPGESLLLFKTEANNFNRCHGHYVNTVDIDPEIEELILK